MEEKLKSIKLSENAACSSHNPPLIHASQSNSIPRVDAKAFDLVAQVKELHRLNSQEISKLLKQNEKFSLLHVTENGSTLQVDMDKLVRFLPLHLIGVLLSSQKDEASLRYLLSGLRLLNSLCEIAPRHPKLEQVPLFKCDPHISTDLTFDSCSVQILLDDVRVSEQLLDLVFYVLISCSACNQGNHFSGVVPLLYAAIIACAVYLLTACISSQWNELAFVLHAHPKIDIFIDASFGAVRRIINFIRTNLSSDDYTLCSNPSLALERAFCFFCQQCEASLQFLQQVCQNKSFQERLLKNKELCGKGGILRLVQAALNLTTPPILKKSRAVVAAVSRLKARALSILLYLCEAENVSYLDEVASIPESLDLAKSVALEILGLLKTMLCSDLRPPENHLGKTYPMGLLQLNALRLADIFSDDSNLRSYITIYFAEVLAAVLSIPYQKFLSSWCTSDLPVKEEDVSLDYEPYTVAGWVLNVSSLSDICNVEICESNFIPIGSAQTFYAHQRTSLLVKVIANLHCFVPNMCKEQERNLFLHKFLDHLKIECQDPLECPSQPSTEFSSNSGPQNSATVCKNLRSLLAHAESLIPTFLNEEDVQLLRVFFTQVQAFTGSSDLEVNRALEMQNVRDCSSPLHRGEELDLKSSNSIVKEGMSENSAFPGLCSPFSKDERVDEADNAIQDVNICESKSSKASPERLLEFEMEAHNAGTSGSDFSSSGGKNLAGEVGNGEATKPGQWSYKSNVKERAEADGAMEDVNTCENKSTKASLEMLPVVEKEARIQETSVSNLSPARVQNLAGGAGNGEIAKSSEYSYRSNIRGSQDNEKVDSLNCKEKQTKKRKRSIMNDTQASLFRRAVQEEPDMHKKAASLNSWAARLSCHGSEVTPRQLKNWLNNRKAKLARVTTKDGCLSSDETLTFNQQNGSTTFPSANLPERLPEHNSAHAKHQDQISLTGKTLLGTSMSQNVEIVPPECATPLKPQNCQFSNSNSNSNSVSARLVAGQAVVLTDSQSKEIAKGTVVQVEGEWRGCNLANTSTCVVDITELKSDRIVKLPYPSGEGGATFEQAELKVVNMRVLWDFCRIRVR